MTQANDSERIRSRWLSDAGHGARKGGKWRDGDGSLASCLQQAERVYCVYVTWSSWSRAERPTPMALLLPTKLLNVCLSLLAFSVILTSSFYYRV